MGSISKSHRNILKYRVESIHDITKYIIPHFSQYPLQTQKAADFSLFERVALLMDKNQHLNIEGLTAIVSIKGAVNKGLSKELLYHFSNIIIVGRPIIRIKNIPDANWIAGFVEAEGCFKVSIRAKKNNKYQVIIVFQITQHSRDKHLLNMIINYFCCGKLEKDNRNPAYHFAVYKFLNNYETIIPFFKKNKLWSIKALNFKDWSTIGEMMKKGKHLTIDGVKKIEKIKLQMNNSRFKD